MTRAPQHEPQGLTETDDRRETSRRCIVTGENLPVGGMIRFVLSPAKVVTPDINRKLPGRGLWVSATQEALKLAVLRNRFAASAKTSVTIPPDLLAQVEKLCLTKLENTMGMANRANMLAAGIDNVMNVLRLGKAGVYLTASPKTSDARRKIAGRAPDLPTFEGFDPEFLGKIAGTGQLTQHIAVASGDLCDKVKEAAEIYTSVVHGARQEQGQDE